MGIGESLYRLYYLVTSNGAGTCSITTYEGLAHSSQAVRAVRGVIIINTRANIFSLVNLQ